MARIFEFLWQMVQKRSISLVSEVSLRDFTSFHLQLNTETEYAVMPYKETKLLHQSFPYCSNFCTLYTE